MTLETMPARTPFAFRENNRALKRGAWFGVVFSLGMVIAAAGFVASMEASPKRAGSWDASPKSAGTWATFIHIASD